jgi:hypothetical protein
MTSSIDGHLLLHVSEEAGIRRFEPRLTNMLKYPVVWAVDAAHLRNYLLPRDCPRVSYYSTANSTAEDVSEFLGGSKAVVVVEERWLDRIASARLYCYRMPPESFACIDEGAGYFVSEEAVVPLSVEMVSDPIRAIRDAGADFRSVANLWPIHDAVARSSLQFSMIRMRNAQPPLSNAARR